MSSKTVYLQFTVYLTDPVQVAALQTTTHDGGGLGYIIMAPTVAATTYSAPILALNEPFVAPSIVTPWFTHTDNNFPLDERTFERCKGGWFGICGLFGTRTTYYWRGTFALAPTIDPVNSPIDGEVKVAMATRRWIDGAEMPSQTGVAPGEDGTLGGLQLVSRGASRHLGGYGYKFDSTASDDRRHKPGDSGGTATKELWERFYVRFHRFSTAKTRVWSVEEGAHNRVELSVLPSGALVAANVVNAGTVESIFATTSPLTTGVWYKLDILYRFGGTAPPATANFFQLFINGVRTVNAGPFTSGDGGLGTNANINESTIGPKTSATNTLVMDIDDWIGAALPTIGSEIRTGTTTSGTAIVTGLSSTATIQVGAGVIGTGIPANTRVLTVDSPTKITLDTNATASGTVPLTFGHSDNYPGLDWNNGSKVAWVSAGLDDATLLTGTTTSGSAIVTGLSSTSLLRTGKAVAGTGIPGGATIATVDSATQVTLSANATASGSVPLTFTSASGFATDHNAGAWTGDWRIARQRPVGSSTNLTIGSGAGRLSVVTDAGSVVDSDLNSLGIAALMVGLYGLRVGGTTASLGYKLPAGSDTLVTVSPTTTASWTRAWYRPVGLTDPVKPIGGLEIKLDKPTGMTSMTVSSLQAVAEVIGIFGAEDRVVQPGDPAPNTVKAIAGLHNSPYPRSPWARIGAAPISPVFITGRLYTGTGTFIDLTFRTPIHFLWIRPLVAGNGIWWISAGNGPHAGMVRQVEPEAPVDVAMDPSFVGGAVEDAQETQTVFRIVGTRADSNNTGAIYQVIAIGDPGMRFLECGVFKSHGPGDDLVTTLQNTAFTPECLFGMLEDQADTGNGVGYYKGPGHAATAINRLVGAEITSNWLAMSAGTLTSKSAFGSAAMNQIAYCAMRRNDNSGDAGVPRFLQLTSYTGDGSASRTIGLSPITGRRPLFGLVVPHDSASVQRDPSHTGTTSTTLPNSANASTGITGGGVDSISVGSALNANGIVYDVFVIPGSTTACNNGWGCNGDFDPVEPDVPSDPGPWDPEPSDPGAPIPPPTTPPPPDGGDPDFGPDCIVPSTKVINQALSRIGVSKRVVDINTDLTAEASAARLHYGDVVTAVLRDFPWPFATKYATLAVVAGPSPVANADWLYSYRRPTDAVFERRIVVPRTGALDPTPPPFQLSSDTAGGLLFTNQASATLEYTFRPNCSAGFGDPLFKEALTWKLAGALGPSLSRMPSIVEHCEQQYLQALAKATMILRPGNPGAVPAAATIDTAAASQAANVAVVNRALLRMGARTVPNLSSDQGREATAVRVVFEDELKATLRDFPWPFASKYATLSVVSGPAPPANSDWLYSYRQPTDCVFERRLVVSRGTALDPPAVPFQLSADATGGLILTNVASAVLEYTARIDGAVAMADALFKDALAWRLVAALAPSLAAVDPTQPEQQGRGPDDPMKPHEHPTPVAQRHGAQVIYAMQMYRQLITQAEHVLRVGKPGAVPAATVLDATQAQKDANTNVVNRALVRIGAQTIASLQTDQSREAVAARLIFEDELQSTLRDFPWGFATVYATPALVGGTSAVGVNGDWQYSYRLPTDAVFIRRTVTSVKRAYEAEPPPFHVSRDVTGGLIYTNQTPAVVEYTARLDGTVLKSDAVFRDAFAWRLAASLAPSLAQIDPTKPEQLGRGPDPVPKDPPRVTQQIRLRVAEWAWTMYTVALSTAKKADANEQQQTRQNPDADWITGRE